MIKTPIFILLGACALGVLLYKLRLRLQLSRAKHRSLTGHARMARRFARLVPFYEYDESEVFSGGRSTRRRRGGAARRLHALGRYVLPNATKRTSN